MVLTELEVDRLHSRTDEVGNAAEAMAREAVEGRDPSAAEDLRARFRERLREQKAILAEHRQAEEKWRDDVWRERVPCLPEFEAKIRENIERWLHAQISLVRDFAPRLAKAGLPVEEVADAEIDLYLAEKALREWKSPKRSILVAFREKRLTDEQMKALDEWLERNKSLPSQKGLYKEARVYDPDNPVISQDD